MRQSESFVVVRNLVASMAIVFCAVTAFGQGTVAKEGNTTIPEGVFQVLKPSCMPCHSNEGKDKPKAAVNFSTWDQYTSTEKMMLAASVKGEVQEKKMPPKKFLESHPEAKLSEEQLTLILQWCDSLQSKR